MNQITTEELNQWLDNPLTRGFLALIKRDTQRSLDRAYSISREDFFKNQKSEDATQCYAAAFGMAIISRNLENLIEEFKEIEKEEDQSEKEKISDAITNFLNFINKKEEK